MEATIPPVQETRAGALTQRSSKESAPKQTTPPKGEGYNPYLAARQEWDDRYGELAARAQRSDRNAAISKAIALASILAVIALALRPTRTVVIAVNSAGQLLGSGVTGRPMTVTRDMKIGILADWVGDLRLVTPDGLLQRSAIEKVYAKISSGSSAQTVVSDFYRDKPPQISAQTETVHVDINSVLPTSDTTYEVEWLETTRDLQGKVLIEQRWKGAFTFVISSTPPTDERLLRLNPIGLYITQASWSKVL